MGRKVSPTAASATNRLYGSSGKMRYLVLMGTHTGAGQRGTVVEASTGDEAAELALAKNPGVKVLYVGPATDAPPAIEEVSE